ncbi:MAG: exonuclease SbcCD subunit D [Sporomusaceae bacterium]|nr:exonuclease SbcCD subunit D [Sporomusaceae bacterium]
MKIIHTSDWHIGKIVNQVYMTEDQAVCLASLIDLLREEQPDALVIAGDVYDRSIPPVEAVELLDKTLSTILLELKIPILMIAGNHDSPDRLGFGSHLLEAGGLYIAGPLTQQIKKVSLSDEYGPVHFYLLPYAPPALVRDVFQAEAARDHDSAMKVMIEAIQSDWDATARNILVTHGFVRGIKELTLSESEKPLSYTLSIGGADYVDVELFSGFTYTALGHLHRPQQAGTERVRYAGSLLKYSASEVAQKKSVTLLTIGKDQAITIEEKVLQQKRDMRKVTGSIQELLMPDFLPEAAKNDYLFVTLTDQAEILDPMGKLRTLYPNVLGLDFLRNEGAVSGEKTAAGEGYKQQGKLELFEDFYGNMTGQTFDETKKQILAEVIAQVETAGREE